jgi:methylated-DNA-[protein]-cysteine S-methyltransferase
VAYFAHRHHIHRIETDMAALASTRLPSPVGELLLVASDQGLVAILWSNDNPRRVPLGDSIVNPRHPILVKTAAQLREYFDGRRKTFDLPLDMRGTPFQRSVWHALTTIPFGETRSYLDLARQLDNPAATRAVGAANGRNPISIIVPCHRVIGTSGKLTGFAGGLEIKAQLLEHESAERRLFR